MELAVNCTVVEPDYRGTVQAHFTGVMRDMQQCQLALTPQVCQALNELCTQGGIERPQRLV
jgi:hypothetical protein